MNLNQFSDREDPRYYKRTTSRAKKHTTSRRKKWTTSKAKVKTTKRKTSTTKTKTTSTKPIARCTAPAGYVGQLRHRWLVDPNFKKNSFSDCIGHTAVTLVDPQKISWPTEVVGKTARIVADVQEKAAGMEAPAWIPALGTSDFTVTMWTKMGLNRKYTDNIADLQRWELFSNRGGYDSVGNWISIRARNYDNSITFDLNDDKGGMSQDAIVGVVLLNSTVPSLDFKWHHLAFTRKGPKISIFVDGKLGANETATGGRTANLSSSGYPLGIIYSPFWPDTFKFWGRIDDVRLYKEALDESKLQLIIDAYLGI